MKEYHKIDSIFKRDMEKPTHPFIFGDWAKPEFEFLKNNTWEFTEKIDGTNIRIMFDGNEITFGGKSDNAQIPVTLVKFLQNKFLPMLPKFKEHFCKDENKTQVCFYGEGFGTKIQKGGGNYIPNGVNFYLFDINIGGWWLKREDVIFLGEVFGLILPVIVSYGTIPDAIDIVKKGFKSKFGTADAEGLVLRPTVDLFNRKGERIITKVKHCDFY